MELQAISPSSSMLQFMLKDKKKYKKTQEISKETRNCSCRFNKCKPVNLSGRKNPVSCDFAQDGSRNNLICFSAVSFIFKALQNIFMAQKKNLSLSINRSLTWQIKQCISAKDYINPCSMQMSTPAKATAHFKNTRQCKTSAAQTPRLGFLLYYDEQ